MKISKKSFLLSAIDECKHVLHADKSTSVNIVYLQNARRFIDYALDEYLEEEKKGVR
ncbi:hypothetical protein TEHN7126_1973 [Tetragenococcus halophilus subsp. halophilus]|uniref:hypothetical protein n=1 Tax=Tetragenococcus halophilus TaxID=51669 RepID=UPI000CB81292|nr:hypothetical protein [Tetragenococcus halophilus]GBD73853.1 hypothetical protein TEHN7125_2013 [Tetragenococcus halophilus subsp. halophilus]GBD76274.1 hypothetical protein TEHN7126_1973 [Tetragenococcus halophilus subsp. halophilus]